MRPKDPFMPRSENNAEDRTALQKELVEIVHDDLREPRGAWLYK